MNTANTLGSECGKSRSFSKKRKNKKKFSDKKPNQETVALVDISYKQTNDVVIEEIDTKVSTAPETDKRKYNNSQTDSDIRDLLEFGRTLKTEPVPGVRFTLPSILKESPATCRANNFLKILRKLLDPIYRGWIDITIETVDDLFLESCIYSQSFKFGNICLAEASSNIAQETVQDLVSLLKKLFVIHCAKRGFLADDFIEFNSLQDVQDYQNHCDENIDILVGVFEKLISYSLKIDNVIQSEFQRVKNCYVLFQSKKFRECLTVHNIVYVMNDILARIEFNMPVSHEEVLQVVTQSCESDFGALLFLLDKRQSLLFNSQIAELLLRSLKTVAGSTDLRRKKAFYDNLPKIIASLSAEEHDELAEKFANNVKTNVEKWLNFVADGELLGGEVVNDPITNSVLKSENAKEIADVLLFHCLIAPYKSSAIAEGFCKKLARILIFENHLDMDGKKLLVEALTKLPEHIRNILYIKNTSAEDSLYSIFHITLKEMSLAEFKYRGKLALDLLIDILRPSEILKAILPKMEDSSLKAKVGIFIQLLVGYPQLFEEVKKSESFCMKSLFDTVMKQYEEPRDAQILTRFTFINSTLAFLAKLHDDNMSLEIVAIWKQWIKEAQLTWYQNVIMIYGFFGRHKTLFEKPEFKKPESLSYISLMESRFFAPLSAWQGDIVKESFSIFYQEHLTDICPIMVSCALLDCLYIRNLFPLNINDYVHEFIEQICQKVQGVIKSSENENSYCLPSEENNNVGDDDCDSIADVMNTTLTKVELEFEKIESLEMDNCSKDLVDKDDKLDFLLVLRERSCPVEICRTVFNAAKLIPKFANYITVHQVNIEPNEVIFELKSNDSQTDGSVNELEIPTKIPFEEKRNQPAASVPNGNKWYISTFIYAQRNSKRFKELFLTQFIGRGGCKVRLFEQEFNCNISTKYSKMHNVEIRIKASDDESLARAKTAVEDKIDDLDRQWRNEASR